MPKIEYKTQAYHTEDLRLIEQLDSVLTEYKKKGYTLTLRQLFYRLVVRGIVNNDEIQYRHLADLIIDARNGGMLDWFAIEDRSRILRQRTHWDTPEDIMNNVTRLYHIDHWLGQQYYVEVWLEKDALIGVVGNICDELDVPYYSCRGYISQSELWSVAQRMLEHQKQYQSIVILFLGDHDPSGLDTIRDLDNRLGLFGVQDIIINRLALNMDQITEFKLPPNPSKIPEGRSLGYVKSFGNDCWELDAMEPDLISVMIKKSIRRYRDGKKYNSIIRRELNEKEKIRGISDQWIRISEHWNDLKDIF